MTRWDHARSPGALALVAVLLGACGVDGLESPSPRLPLTASAGAEAEAVAEQFVLTIVGTNDLHGHIRSLPVLAGHLAILRDLRAHDGALLLLDAGDMFQGTLPSNMTEGAAVIRGYNAMDVNGAAVGNHEFDYGPVGNAVTVKAPGDDPRGALFARASEASFPMLAANLLEKVTGEPVQWPGVARTAQLQRGPVRIGLIGVTTEDTLTSTLADNVKDLAMAPIADTIRVEATRLRAEGADVVVVLAHAGAACDSFENPGDLARCDGDEIMEVAASLSPDLVNLIVAGHTHKGMAHWVHGIPIIESFAYGAAFGRVDMTFSRRDRSVREVKIHTPHFLCAARTSEDESCEPEPYEGRAVVSDVRVAEVIAPDLEAARVVEEQPLGVTLMGPLLRDRLAETPLSNWLADEMRAARRGDVAVIQAGGIRRDLAAGPVPYGDFYELYPFDNRFALARLTGGELAAMVLHNLSSDRSFQSLSGVRVEARCEHGEPRVYLWRTDGRRIRPRDRLKVVLSDYLATSGLPALAAAVAEGRVTLEDGHPIREVLARRFREGPKVVDPADPTLQPTRISYPTRPLHCSPSG